MKFAETLLPVITLLIGWCLNSLTAAFQEWRDNRKALGKAIADLLEIRHDLHSRKMAMETLKQLGNLNPNEERLVWGFISKAMPQSDDMPKRYNEAVTSIASVDPLLGFQLRSKDMVSKIGSVLSQIEAQVGQSISMISEMEIEIYRAAMPHLNEVILVLSKKHGFITGRKVGRFINDPQTEVPKELNSLLALIQKEVKQAKDSGTLTPDKSQTTVNIQNDC